MEINMLTTPEQRLLYDEQGFIMIPSLFSPEEVAVLKAGMAALHTDQRVGGAEGRTKGGMVVEDADTSRLQFYIHRGGTRFDLLARHPRMARIMQELMAVPMDIYHSKLAFKAAFTGSVQFWRQDYGYWITAKHPQPKTAPGAPNAIRPLYCAPMTR